MNHTPERIYNVSQTQLSVARFYGGCSLNGADYHYDAESDTLTRIDVWKAQCASSKKEGAKAAKAEREKWTKAQQSFAEFSNALSSADAEGGRLRRIVRHLAVYPKCNISTAQRFQER